MEVPAVKINSHGLGGGSGEKLIKSVVNMVGRSLIPSLP